MRFIVKDIPPYDGEYEFDGDRALSGYEWEWVTHASGVRPLTLGDGFAGGDPNLFIGLTVVAMVRSGKVAEDDTKRVTDILKRVPWDGEKIRIAGDEQEDEDQIPLALTPTQDEQSPSGSLSSVG